LIFALLIVQLLLYATVRARPLDRKPAAFARLNSCAVVTMFQIAIGTQVRGGIDTALRSGAPRAAALASINLIDQLHRNVAPLVFAGSILIVFGPEPDFPKERILIRWVYLAAGLASLLVGLGITMACVSLKPIAQVARLAIASLLLRAETLLVLIGPGGSVSS
jgi:heme A synthase